MLKKVKKNAKFKALKKLTGCDSIGEFVNWWNFLSFLHLFHPCTNCPFLTQYMSKYVLNLLNSIFIYKV